MNSLVKQKHLRLFSRYLSKRHNKWFAALEQSGVSATNFLISLLVLLFGGVTTLGEYGFWFALSSFSTMIAAGFAINQMVLHVANASIVKQRAVLLITLLVVIALQVIPATILWWLVKSQATTDSVLALSAPIIIYAVFFSIAELTRQFLYMRGRQRLSLVYAAVSTSLAISLFAGFVFFTKPTSILEGAFWCLAAIQFGYVFVAAFSARAWRFAAIPTKFEAIETSRFYWIHGRLAAGGMLVGWAQNKSINPMLVFTLDMVAAGFYQIARMCIMPISMITTGIARSAMADVRRAWGDGDERSLQTAISSQLKISVTVVFTYLLVVGAVFLLVKSYGLKEIPENLLLVFVSAAVVVILSNFRYWMSQYQVVQLRFAFLFRIGCVAAIISLLWMLLSGVFLKSAALVVLGSAVGELYMLVELRRRYIHNGHNDKTPRAYSRFKTLFKY